MLLQTPNTIYVFCVRLFVRSQATSNAKCERFVQWWQSECSEKTTIWKLHSLCCRCCCVVLRDYPLPSFCVQILWTKKFFASFSILALTSSFMLCMCAFLAISFRSTLLARIDVMGIFGCTRTRWQWLQRSTWLLCVCGWLHFLGVDVVVGGAASLQLKNLHNVKCFSANLINSLFMCDRSWCDRRRHKRWMRNKIFIVRASQFTRLFYAWH